MLTFPPQRQPPKAVMSSRFVTSSWAWLGAAAVRTSVAARLHTTRHRGFFIRGILVFSSRPGIQTIRIPTRLRERAWRAWPKRVFECMTT